MKERKIAKRSFFIVVLIILLVLITLNSNFVESNYYKSKKIETQKAKTNLKPTKIKRKKVVKKIIYKKVKLLSKHSITNWNSSSNRNTNMKVAAKIINGDNNNGYLMKEGMRFSWLKIVGQTTSKKGFLPAPVIINKQHAEGLGGGVCQVASTINSAVIKAGLKTEAVKHSVSVGYLSDNDYEATVSYDSSKDLKFRNTFKFPIMIKVLTINGTVTVKVFEMKKYTKLVKR